jgi:hypothetical protein
MIQSVSLFLTGGAAYGIAVRGGGYSTINGVSNPTETLLVDAGLVIQENSLVSFYNY